MAIFYAFALYNPLGEAMLNWKQHISCPFSKAEMWLERSSNNTSVYHVEKILGEWTFSMGKIRGVVTPFNFRQTRNNECPKAREARYQHEANAIKLRERVRVLTKSN